MINEWFYALAIGLNLVPFLYLRYYPFRNRLRTSGRWLFLSQVVAFLVQTAAYLSVYLSEGKVFYEQGFLLHDGFIAVYFIYSLCMIQEDVYRQLYLLFPLALYNMATFGAGVWMESIAGGLASLPRFLVLDVTVIVLVAVTFPIALRFLAFMEIIFERKSTGEWKWGWIPAACFYFLEIVHTLVSAQSPGVMALSRLASFTAVTVYLLFQIWFLYVQRRRVILQQNLRLSQELAKQQADQIVQLQQQETEFSSEKAKMEETLERLQQAAERRDARSVSQILAEGMELQDGSLRVKHYSSQGIFNAVLGMEEMYARNKGIRMEIRVNMKKDIPMEERDICVLFCSLLDNAREACMVLPENQRWITLRMEVTGNMVAIEAENSCNTDSIRRDGDIFYSAKRGYDAPGTGIISICEIAKKYDGTVKFCHKEGIFKAQILCRGGRHHENHDIGR